MIFSDTKEESSNDEENFMASAGCFRWSFSFRKSDGESRNPRQFEDNSVGQWVEVGGGRSVFVRRLGSPQGPVILLESGINSFSLRVDPLVQALAKVAHVISYDRFTYGLSYAPVDKPSLKQAALDTKALVDALGVAKPFIYVGYSLGAVYAAHFSLEFPDSLHSLVLVDPPLLGKVSPSLSRVEEAFLPQNLDAMFGYPRIKYELGGLVKNRDGVTRIGKSYKHIAMTSLERRYMIHLVGEVPWMRLPKKLPLLVLTNGFLNKQGQQFQKEITESVDVGRHVILKDAHHMSFVEKNHAGKVAQLVRWAL